MDFNFKHKIGNYTYNATEVWNDRLTINQIIIMYLKIYNITTTSNIIHNILLCIINIIKMVFIKINIKADDYNNTFHYSLAI